MIVKAEIWHGELYVLGDDGSVWRMILRPVEGPTIEKLGDIGQHRVKSLMEPQIVPLFYDGFRS